MVRLLPVLWLAFKIWMMVDAGRRRAPYYWFFIILAPFGAVVYFFVFKLQDFKLGELKKVFERPPSLEELRYRSRVSPSLENRVALAQALHDAGALEEAIARFDEILEDQPDTGDALYGAAMARIGRGDHGGAIPLLSRLAEKDPTYFDYAAWPALAHAYWENGQKDEGLASLRSLVALNPRPDHRLVLAQCLKQLGEAREARQLLEETLEDYRHSPRFAKRRYHAVAAEMRGLLKQL